MIITYDWEFIERGAELPIVPISLGMVREDGERLYLVNGEMPLSQLARHPWLQHNVVPYLPIKMQFSATMDAANSIIEWDPEHTDYNVRVGLDEMRHRVQEFTYCESVELWGYYAAYDHVVLGQLFGTMTEWPSHLPQFTRDIMQEWERLGRPPLPRQPASIHHALHDAQWNMEALQSLQLHELEVSNGQEGGTFPPVDDQFPYGSERAND
jgi:hypothetical protein